MPTIIEPARGRGALPATIGPSLVALILVTWGGFAGCASTPRSAGATDGDARRAIDGGDDDEVDAASDRGTDVGADEMRAIDAGLDVPVARPSV